MRASTNEVTKAVRKLIADTELPVVETYQAAGAISRELEDHFFGRVGLFRNQPGDILLEEADLVISIGYDQSSMIQSSGINLATERLFILTTIKQISTMITNQSVN